MALIIDWHDQRAGAPLPGTWVERVGLRVVHWRKECLGTPHCSLKGANKNEEVFV